MSEADAAYYRRRACEERARAKQAKQPEAAAIHKELARQYEALAGRNELVASVVAMQQQRLNGRQRA